MRRLLICAVLAIPSAAVHGCSGSGNPPPAGTDADADSDADTDADTDTDADADTDTDTDANTDTATDSDLDTDTGSDPLTEAFFLADSMRIGETWEGCDLNGDQTVDNRIGALANWLVNNGVIDEHPDDSLAEGIAEGKILVVIRLDDVDDFTADPQLVLAVHEASLPEEEGDAGVPEDLFGGFGSVVVEEPPHTEITGAAIADGWLFTPVSDIVVTIPLDDVPTTMTLHEGRLRGRFDPAPDEQMLVGAVADGMICGAVNRYLLADVLAAELEMDPVTKGLLSTFLGGIADIDCGLMTCHRISIGLPFTAVSARRFVPD